MKRQAFIAARADVLISLALICAVLAYHAPAVASQAGGKETTLTGMWWIEDYQAKLLPEGGADLPFTATGRERYQQDTAQLAAGTLVDPGVSTCLPEGLPRTLFAVYPMQIVEHGQYVTFIHEINHTFWSASVDGKHSPPDDVDPTFMGESIGKWEQGTFVVDSIGFKARSFLDDSGLPHSDKLHVILRFRRVSHQQLQVVATIDDPEIFTAPWNTRRVFELRPDVKLTDFVCGEPHRTLPGNKAAATPLKWVAK